MTQSGPIVTLGPIIAVGSIFALLSIKTFPIILSDVANLSGYNFLYESKQ